MYCNKCGNEIDEKSEFCSKCGTKVKQNSNKEKKKAKEMSKPMRIFVIILLSILFIYFSIMVIFSVEDTFSEMSSGEMSMLPAFCMALILAILCGYGIIKNIKKIRGKDKIELTVEQVQKRKKRNTIWGVSGIAVVVFVIVGFSLYRNYTDTTEKEQLLSKIKEYRDSGYIELSDNEYQELEQSSNTEIEERLNKIEDYIKPQEEYNEKYSAKLDEIYAKEIKVELYQSEDNNYMYIPFNTNTGKRYAKAQVEYVTISKYANNIIDIYYSVEMELTVINKYGGKTVSSGTVKKYYKVENINELDKTIEISGYKGLDEELMNAIQGKTNVVVARPSENNNFKYDFINI